MEDDEVVKSLVEAAGYKAISYDMTKATISRLYVRKRTGQLNWGMVLDIEGAVVTFRAQSDNGLRSCFKFDLCSPTSFQDILARLKKCMAHIDHFKCDKCIWCP